MVRNSLSLQKVQYREKKSLEGAFFFSFELLSYLHYPVGIGFLAVFRSVLMFQ